MLRFTGIGRMSFGMSPIRLFSRTGMRSSVFTRFQSTAPPPQKRGLKALIKEYGFSALGVYLAISTIDLPICYVVVHSMGKEEIQYYENKAKQVFGYGVSDEELKKAQEIAKIQEEIDKSGTNTSSEKDMSMLHYLLSQFSWTEFAIAYGIHKSLIFIRVPVTAAITPGIVAMLRRWGFKIGTDKVATTAHKAKDVISDITASNPKFGVKPGKRKWWWLF